MTLCLYEMKTTRYVFVKHGCHRRQQSQNTAKISKFYILTPPHPQGHVMSVKCEEPIAEFKVQVWLLYHQPNLNIALCKRDRITDRQTDRQTIRLLDAPGGPFRLGASKSTQIRKYLYHTSYSNPPREYRNMAM